MNDSLLFRLRPPFRHVLLAALAALVLSAAAPCGAVGRGIPPAGGETESEVSGKRYFVDLVDVAPEEARKLAALGFDIAGIEAEARRIGVVATGGELDALREMGFEIVVRESSHPLNFSPTALSEYTDPAEMSTFLDQVQAAYPNLAKKVLVKSGLFDSHEVWALRITKDVDLPNDRPVFLVDAQHHAREVMTAEIARDMIDYLTSRYATDSQVRTWVDSVEIWIVPVVNPDGAAWVFSSDSNWRKNRHPSCPVDINRNYGFNWNACAGSSGLCSDETYRGSAPESEPETQGMVQLFADRRPFFSLSYHSYGQYLLYSYGCVDPNEKGVMDGIAQSLNSILVKDNGTAGGWLTGPIWSTIYSADGGSSDTAYGRYGAYAYTIEVNSSSFQPTYSTWRNLTVQRQRTAWQFFLDKTLGAPQIRGKVTDALTGLPLAAEVAVQEMTFTHGESPRTADSRGLYAWLVASGGTYHVTFSAPGFCPTTRTVTVGTGPYTLDVGLTHPLAPAGVTATPAGDNAIDLSWSPVAGATEYRILRSPDAGTPFAQVAAVPGGTTTWQDSPVSGGVTWRYVVRAFESCESPDSSEASAAATGPCTIGPAFGGVLSVSNPALSTCALVVRWGGATPRCGGPATFRVYRSATAPFVPGPSSLVAAGISGTEWTDRAALASGTPHHYIVRSVDAASGAEDGNFVSAVGIPTGPSSLGTWSDDAGDSGTAKMILGAPWSVLASGGRVAPKVYATGTYGNGICASLTSPVLTLGANAVLSFNAKYDIETNYDAGIVEIATGPGFSSWAKLTTVGYPNTLSNAGNACGFSTGGAGTAFSSTLTVPAYSASPYSGSLSAYSGKDVRLRWTLSTDSGVTGKGWWVDDIQITNVMIPGSCSAGSAPNPKEASPAGSSMRLTPTAEGNAIALAYSGACGALDHVLYAGVGPISGNVAWSSSICSLGNDGLAVVDPGEPPAGGLLYFVLVGQNGSREGSYGRSWTAVAGTERPEATGVGSCHRSQDLTGSCP
jgi:hypothetical protein